MIFVTAVKNIIAPCSTALQTLSFPKIVVKPNVQKSTKNVAKAPKEFNPGPQLVSQNRYIFSASLCGALCGTRTVCQLSTRLCVSCTQIGFAP